MSWEKFQEGQALSLPFVLKATLFTYKTLQKAQVFWKPSALPSSLCMLKSASCSIHWVCVWGEMQCHCATVACLINRKLPLYASEAARKAVLIPSPPPLPPGLTGQSQPMGGVNSDTEQQLSGILTKMTPSLNF